MKKGKLAVLTAACLMMATSAWAECWTENGERHCSQRHYGGGKSYYNDPYDPYNQPRPRYYRQGRYPGHPEERGGDGSSGYRQDGSYRYQAPDGRYRYYDGADDGYNGGY